MIYFVEDDNSIRELVCYTLESSGIPAEGFASPAEFRQAMKKQQPLLVLLDIMLPEESGLDLLKALRQDPSTQKLPVMMLSARGSEYDKVVGLDMGADDYLPKPFGMMELVSRVKALLRRSAPPSPEEATFQEGELFVDPSRHQVSLAGKPLQLTQKEFELLCLLLENRGLVLTRDRILHTVWGYTFAGESRTVDVHIRTLRQKLGDAGNNIRTIRGYGYKFGGEDE